MAVKRKPSINYDALNTLLLGKKAVLGYTYDDLAALSGISRRTLMCRAKSPETYHLKELCVLASALKIDMRELAAAMVAEASRNV